MTWHQELVRTLTGEGWTISDSDLEHASAHSADSLVRYLDSWWQQPGQVYGIHDLLALLRDVPTGWMAVYEAELYGPAISLLSKSPEHKPIGEVIRILHTTWDQLSQRWGGPERMFVGDQAHDAITS